MITQTIKKLGGVINSSTVLDSDVFNGTFSGVCIDSRAIKPGNCFFAIKGENFDGHDHVDAALKNGAACAVVSNGYRQDGKAILHVGDTIAAMGDLSRWYRNQLDAKVIAITGSAGKTTVREMVYHVLSQHYKCCQSPKSFNNNIGLPLTLLAAGGVHEIIITEIGSNSPGEIEHLTNIAQPDVAIVTNILPVHLEGFGSIETIVAEKASIAAGLKEGGKLIVNGDVESLVEYCETKKYGYVTFGTTAGCDTTASNITTTSLTGKFTVDGTDIEVFVPGKANVSNAIAAWAICKEFGVTGEQFAIGMKTFLPISMRMQIETLTRISDNKIITLINDCYNANPASMANALECLAQLKSETNRRSVFICGTMGELGEQSEKLHAEVGKIAAEKNVDVILAVGEFTNVLVRAAEKHAKEPLQTELFENTAELCGKLQDFVRGDDIILVKGSRSVKLEDAVSKLVGQAHGE
jgi:UDP-N-acetylmuramoyl-tripeptide--D-alanyl-D-alanine ligase